MLEIRTQKKKNKNKNKTKQKKKNKNKNKNKNKKMPAGLKLEANSHWAILQITLNPVRKYKKGK